MTVVIGYSSDDFSILATDSRLLKLDGTIEDRMSKLISLPYPLGWCAGLGYAPYLEIFKEIAIKSYVNDIDQIESYIDLACKLTLEEFPDGLPGILRSQLFLTYINNNSESIPVVDSYLFKGFDLYNYYSRANMIDIGYPTGYDYEKIQLFRDKHNLDNEIRGNIDEVLKVVLNIFYEISNTSDGVSSVCEVGIQFREGMRKYSFSGEIMDLLQNRIHFEQDKKLSK